MDNNLFRLSYVECRQLMRERLAEPAPARIQLLCGPRQVGKTTLLLELADQLGAAAVYAAADAPEASLPGFWERLRARAIEVAEAHGRSVIMLDEAHLLHGWSAQLKALWDGLKRKKARVHIIATGSSALHLAAGSRESLAGRFERVTLTHWSASSFARVFKISPPTAAELVVRQGTYPGAYALRDNLPRWSAYVRDAILEPAIGRDILALAAVRRPALLRQIFGVSATSPAQIVSLQKLQGQLQDAGALETIAQYLSLLQEAFLVAPLQKYSVRSARRRSSPPKLITLNNALVAVMDPQGIAQLSANSARFGAWVENACLAHAWNSGQEVSYWREEPYEVDAVIEGTWGEWAVEVKTGAFHLNDLKGLLELTRRHAKLRPLVICSERSRRMVEQANIAACSWQQFLVEGPPQR